MDDAHNPTAITRPIINHFYEFSDTAQYKQMSTSHNISAVSFNIIVYINCITARCYVPFKMSEEWKILQKSAKILNMKRRS